MFAAVEMTSRIMLAEECTEECQEFLQTQARPASPAFVEGEGQAP